MLGWRVEEHIAALLALEQGYILEAGAWEVGACKQVWAGRKVWEVWEVDGMLALVEGAFAVGVWGHTWVAGA